MTVESAATFLAGSLLIGLALCFLTVVIVFVNNVFSRFWVPIKWLNFIDIPLAAEQQPKQEEKKK
jgi:hypothetical protein